MSAAPGARAHNHPLDFFDRIFVINLKSRPDRRRELEAEFARIGFASADLVWFEAVKPDDMGPFDSLGARGCFMSHLGVLDAAAGVGVDRVLLLEDDVNFAADFNTRLAAIVEQLRVMPWQMFYGGGRVADRTPVAPGLSRVAPEVRIECAHFVAFRGAILRTLHDYIANQLTRPPGDPAGGPMHVDGSYSWARRELGFETLMATPDICSQRASRSDIAETPWWDRVPGLRHCAQLLRRLRRAYRG